MLRWTFPFLAAIAFAADSDWTYVATPNFELYTSAGSKDARSTAEYFEQVRDFFMRARSSGLTTRLPVTIVAFKNRAQYKPYAPNEGSAAFYVGGHNRDYIVLSGTGLEQFPVAVHEYVHLLIRHGELKIPDWLNEGLAEVYSTLKPLGGKLLVGSVPAGRGQVLLLDKWIPIARLLEVTHDSPEYNEKDRAGVFYAQSWLLTHMLMLDTKMRPGFSRFFDLVASGTPSGAAIEQVWGLNLEQLERRLNGYARGNSLNGVLFDMKLEKVEGLTARPAESLDVDVNLALVAGLSGRLEEATSRLEALANQSPDSIHVHEALGICALRKRDNDAARRHYGRAAALNTPDWTTWWNYSRLLFETTGSDEAILKALARTLELNGAHREARFLLAEQFNIAGRHREAIDTLKAVTKVSGDEAARLFLTLSFAHTNLNNDSEARTAAERARQYARTPGQTARASELLRFLDARAQMRSAGPVPVAVSARAPSPLHESDGRAPILMRGKRVPATGIFQELDCDRPRPLLKLAMGENIITLAIADPERITINGEHAQATLTCGRQPPGREVEVEYTPAADAAEGAAGYLRAITFK